MNPDLMRVVLLVPVFLFSLCFHEYAHAWVATKRGDPTPEREGRLTLHPMAHADILGTLLLPIICIYYGAPFFGWAKPVPIDPANFKHGRRDVALVAAAGPLSNILLALFATAGLAAYARLPIENHVYQTVGMFIVVSIQVNLMLAFFNLLPIPPLDGFNVIQGMMSHRVAARLYGFSRHASLLLLILLFTGGFRVLAAPVMACFRWLLAIATS